jgi:hypothetical protein
MAFPQSLIDESEPNQNAILSFSTGRRRVIAKHSGHFVHIDRPDVVEREVVDFIDQIRGNKRTSSPGNQWLRNDRMKMLSTPSHSRIIANPSIANPSVITCPTAQKDG